VGSPRVRLAGIKRTHLLLSPLLALILTGCVGQAATGTSDDRGSGDQAADAKICASIRSRLLARDSGALAVLRVLCNDQLVVIAGALPPDYKLAVEAVHIATRTPGVTRVETFFVPKVAQDANDSAIAAKIKATLAGDDATSTARTDLTVVAGTVVLVGVSDDQAKADRIIANVESVAGVKSVKSFIQLRP
jgi:osmotically-inducible protein OsmY